MKTSHKINKSLFQAINANIKNPFIVLDNTGKVVSFNEEAAKLFPVKREVNFLELFSEQTGTRLSEIIENVYISGNSSTNNLNLTFHSGETLNTKVLISSYKEDDYFFVFCTFIPMESEIKFKGVTSLQIKTNEIADIVKSKELAAVINDIKSLYPFTVIGKERILKSVNSFEELFWIKDIDGNFILVNNKMAAGLGLKITQIEGRPEDSFIISYLVDFWKSVERYMKESLNCVIIEGLPLSGIASSSEYRTIEIPLSDSEENMIAVIGIGQRLEANNEEGVKSGIPAGILKDFPKPAAYIDKDGIIKHGSKEFCKLFSDQFNDLSGFAYNKVLPLKITERIRKFWESADDSISFSHSISPVDLTGETESFTIYLNKIYDSGEAPNGFFLMLEKSENHESIEYLITRRGRMFDILIQNNPEPIFIYDTENLGFIEVNQAALNLYGYRKDEFLKMDLTDLYTPEDIQSLLDSSKSSAMEGKFQGPYKHKKKDGSSIFVEISKVTIKFNEKDAHFNIIKDVTSRLELEKKIKLYQNAFDNTDNLLFVTDASGFITFTNNAVRDILGYAKGQLDKTSFAALVRDNERATVNSTIFHSHIKETVTLTLEIKKSDGKFMNVELTAMPVSSYKDEIESFSIIGKTENEPVEAAVKSAAVQKGASAGILQVEKSADTKDVNFLSNLFHELLTPINVILGFVQEFTDSASKLSPEQQEAAEIINQNRDRLLSTMNSVIEYTNFQNDDSEIVTKEIGITEVIDQLHNEFGEISGSRSIEFAYGKISSSLKFESDPQKFQTLMHSLVKIITHLSNAEKIYFSAYQLNDDSFVISVKDSYASVTPKLLEHLKNIFEKKEALIVKDFGISKLTVRLAKALLEMMHGEFEVFEESRDKADYGFVFPIAATFPAANEIPSEDYSETVSFTESTEKQSPEERLHVAPDSNISKNTAASPYVEDSAEKMQADYSNEKLPEDTPEIEPEFVTQPKRTSERVELSALNCLYIEDQVDSQILFKVQLKELKEIKFAVSFEEALPLLDSHHFDFIVMDINLQGEYNGLDALRIIHKMPGYENIPIIAVTAYVLPGDKEKFIATGFNDFISKPIFREKMIDSLEKIFLMQL